MTKFEKIVGVVFITGFIFKLLGIPGPIFTLGAILLAAYYFIFGFIILNQKKFKNGFKKENYKNITGLRLTGSIVTGISLAFIIFFGILFSTLAIPGPRLIILILYSVVFLIYITTINQENSKYNNNIFRLSFFLVFGWGIYFITPYNEYNIFDRYYGQTLHDFSYGIVENVDYDEEELKEDFENDFQLYVDYFNNRELNKLMDMTMVHSVIYDLEFMEAFKAKFLNEMQNYGTETKMGQFKISSISKVIKCNGYLFCKINYTFPIIYEGKEHYIEKRDKLIDHFGKGNIITNPVEKVIKVKNKEELIAVKVIHVDNWKYVTTSPFGGVPIKIIRELSKSNF